MFSTQKDLLKRPLIRYGFAVCTVAAAFLLRQGLTTYGGPGLPTYITFYPAVMIVAMVTGFWPGIVATVMIALGTDYWILPPSGFGIESFTDIVGLLSFSGMGICMSLLAEFYRRAREQVQKSSLELRRANEELRHLSSRLFSAHEAERKKIALEIHDSLGACLAAIKFKMEHVQLQNRNTVNGPTEGSDNIMPLIQECMQECKRIQMDLRPSMIDDLGLLPTLSWFCKRYESIYSHIQTELTMPIKEGEIPSALKIIIYRVIQEAMNNIAKHSKANLARLSLRKMDTKMEVTIQDNGRGFHMENINTRNGLGLSSMKERAELSGGSFDIESKEGQGTIIRASWPLIATA